MRIKSFRNYLISEAAASALLERAENTGVSVEVLHEVFDRGVVAWDEDTQKTIEQYAFNRVDSFINGGYAAKLDEDLLDEVSKSTLNNYIRKAKVVVANTDADSKSHQKSKKGIERAERKLSEEELSELSSGTLTSYAIKASHSKHKIGKEIDSTPHNQSVIKKAGKWLGRDDGIKKAVKKIEHKAKMNEEAEQLDEISATMKMKYADKAEKSVEKLSNGPYSNKTDNKVFKRGAFARYARNTAVKEESQENNVVDIPETELIERKVLARDDPAQYFSVKKRETKGAKVRQKYNERHKAMYDRHKTETVISRGFAKRTDKDHHLVDKKGHQLTDRIRDQNRERLSKLRKNKTVQEGAEYIEARRALHDAHHESARMHAGAERDPELRRQDLHRAKRHKHASRVLEILAAKRKKK